MGKLSEGAGPATAGCALLAAMAAPVAAQQSLEAPSLREEVVVTARKVEETLQTVPVAVTAFSEEALRRQRIEGIADVALYTPGLVYQNINGTLAVPQIRGLAQTNVVGADNNVGMFLNGIYLSNNRTLDLALIDLERVEVIKGPQSALYGQNSFAGAINYISAKPTETLDAEISGSVGSDELAEFNGSISGPLSDTVSGAFSAAYREFDGTFDNANPQASGNLQGYETTGLSGTLDFRPNDRFLLRVFGYYVDQENDIPAQYLVANNCGSSAFGTPTTYCGELPTDGTFDLSEGVFGLQAENSILSLDIDWEFAPNWWLRSITARVDSESASYFDFDYTSTGVPFGTVDAATGQPGVALINTYLGQGQTEVEDFSQEFRIEYTSDRFEAMLGAFYYDSDRSDASIGAVDISPLGPTETLTSFLGFIFGTTDPIGSPIDSNQSEETVETRALFGRVGWQATDRLRMSAELRWADEDKSINRILNFTFPVASNAQLDANFDSTTPRITVDYQLTDDILLYGVYAKGARAGGFNATATLAAEISYDQEENDTYELGIKSQWLDQRLTLNAAIYQIDWTDLQIPSLSQDPNNIAVVIRNTGEAESTGFELEGSFLFGENLLIGGNYAYTNPEFKDGSSDLGLPCGVDNSICPNGNDVSGQQLGRTAENMWSAYAAANGQLFSNWTWFARADVAYMDDQYLNAINRGYIGEYTLVNARLGMENEQFEIALWSKNLTDEAYLTANSAQPRFHTGAVNDVTFGYGRIVGLSALMRFGQ